MAIYVLPTSKRNDFSHIAKGKMSKVEGNDKYKCASILLIFDISITAQNPGEEVTFASLQSVSLHLRPLCDQRKTICINSNDLVLILDRKNCGYCLGGNCLCCVHLFRTPTSGWFYTMPRKADALSPIAQ